MTFRIFSRSFDDGQALPLQHVHSIMDAGGGNMSPDLQWEGAPAGTKSFALTVFDPDAPTGSGWWHWIVYDIPADVRNLQAGAGTLNGKSLPPGAKQGRTDFGTKEYGGAAPPPGHGPHRYVFKLFALDVEELNVPDDASAAYIGFLIHFAKLAETTTVGVYER